MKIRELLEFQKKQNLSEFDWNPLHWFGGQARAANGSIGREDEDGRGVLRPEWGNMNAPYTNDDPAAVMQYYGTPRVPTGVATHYRIPADSKSERNAEGLGTEPGEHSPLDRYAKYPEQLADDAARSRVAGGSRDPNYRGSEQHTADIARVRQLAINNRDSNWFGNGFASPEHMDRILGLGKYDQTGATASTPYKSNDNFSYVKPGSQGGGQQTVAGGVNSSDIPTSTTLRPGGAIPNAAASMAAQTPVLSRDPNLSSGNTQPTQPQPQPTNESTMTWRDYLALYER